ncbi:MAG TPA: nuclear transport factor 2 family protein [Terriglobales bacterium]|nr:nuclear transport factor 2 family protein [Terriglobales bacterium]
MTSKELKELEEKLIARERSIFAAQKRRDLPAVEAVLAHGFRQISGSGHFFSKAQVLDRLKFVYLLDYWLECFKLVPIDPKCVVLTYIIRVERRYKGQEYANRTYRSSTWVERNGTWQVIFHQATPLEV